VRLGRLSCRCRAKGRVPRFSGGAVNELAKTKLLNQYRGALREKQKKYAV
jgi:hypothetical protein